MLNRSVRAMLYTATGGRSFDIDLLFYDTFDISSRTGELGKTLRLNVYIMSCIFFVREKVAGERASGVNDVKSA